MVGFIQGRFGSPGNFELVAPMSGGGLGHFWRNNSTPAMSWSGAIRFGGCDAYQDASLIQSSYGNPGNLEVVARNGERLAFFWRDSGPAFRWDGPYTIAVGVSGSPSLIQSRFGSPGNFELVAPMLGGGLAHFWRNNSAPNLPWSGGIRFGGDQPYQDATLIQSNYGNPGNLEVIARTGDRLAFFWRDSGPAFQWHGPFIIASGVSGRPSLIQGRFGSPGNFELVAPMESGGLAHFWRNNSVSGLPWSGAIRFGERDVFQSAALFQSNYGSPGNLEVIARSDDRLVFFWRDSGPAFTWRGPFVIGLAGGEFIRVHYKILTTPTIPINTMTASMEQVFATVGVQVQVASTENLNLPLLNDLDIGSCPRGDDGPTTAEQTQLFGNLNNVGANDLVVYFVRSTVPPSNGCSNHPTGRPGAVVASGATTWTLGHEIGHVLGLYHVNDNNRLMTGNGTGNITNPPPDLVAGERTTMLASALTRPC